jgi:hypothetical protein
VRDQELGQGNGCHAHGSAWPCEGPHGCRRLGPEGCTSLPCPRRAVGMAPGTRWRGGDDTY